LALFGSKNFGRIEKGRLKKLIESAKIGGGSFFSFSLD